MGWFGKPDPVKEKWRQVQQERQMREAELDDTLAAVVALVLSIFSTLIAGVFAFSMYLNYLGLEYSMGGTLFQNLKCAVLAIIIAVLLYAPTLLITRVAPFVFRPNLWLLCSVLVFAGIMFLVSGMQNINALVGPAIAFELRNIGIFELQQAVDALKAALASYQGTLIVLDGVKAAADTIPAREAADGSVYGSGIAGCGKDCRALAASFGSIADIKQRLAASMSTLPALLSDLDAAMASLREVAESPEGPGKAKAFGEAFDGVKNAMLSVQSAMGTQAISALASDLRTGFLGEPPTPAAVSGFEWARSILVAQATNLEKAIQPVIEAASIAPPTYKEAESMSKIAELAWEISPSLTAIAVSIDAMSFVFAAIVKGVHDGEEFARRRLRREQDRKFRRGQPFTERELRNAEAAGFADGIEAASSARHSAEISDDDDDLIDDGDEDGGDQYPDAREFRRAPHPLSAAQRRASKRWARKNGKGGEE